MILWSETFPTRTPEMATEQALLGAIGRCCVEILVGGWQRLAGDAAASGPARSSESEPFRPTGPVLVAPPAMQSARSRRLRELQSASDLIQQERDRI